MNLKSFLSWIFTLIVLVILSLTNPTHKQHLQAVDDKFTDQNPIAGGLLKLGKTADVFTQYENYIFFSVLVPSDQKKGKDGKKQLVTIGFLNHIIVADMDIDV